MKNAAFAACLVALAGCGGGGEPESVSGRVATVADGDTIRLDDGTRVRLVQIDAPELRGRECFGAAAAATLRRLVPRGAEVRVDFDEALDRVDRFGRLLGYVFVGRLNVNRSLVEVGAAAPYFFGGDRGRYAEELLDAAERAQKARRGLWGACEGVRLDPERAIDT